MHTATGVHAMVAGLIALLAAVLCALPELLAEGAAPLNRSVSWVSKYVKQASRKLCAPLSAVAGTNTCTCV